MQINILPHIVGTNAYRKAHTLEFQVSHDLHLIPGHLRIYETSGLTHTLVVYYTTILCDGLGRLKHRTSI